MGKKTLGKVLGFAAIVVGAFIPGLAPLVAAVGKVGAAIIGGVVAAGLSAVGSKLVAGAQAKSAGNAKESGIMVAVQDNVATIPIVYGRRRVAGRQIYVTTSGANNKFLHMVFALAEGEIQEIERIVFGDNEIAFDGQVTPMTASTGSLAASSARGRFQNRVSVEWRLGTTNQTAFSSLVSATVGQEGAWTNDHRCLGVAVVHLKFEYDKDKFAQIPQVYFDIKGKKVQTSYTSTTKTWSDNPAAIALDYLTNTTYGKGIALADIDQTSYTDAYNYCNELIDLYTDGGSPIQGKRYLGNGFLDPETPVFDNIKAVLTPFNGYLVWSAGKYHIKVLKEEPILLDVNGEEFTFDESNIIGDISMQMGSKENMANRVKARFYNAALNYAEDVAIYEDDERRVRDDNGEWLELELSLPFTNDYTRAQMLAKQFLEQSRRGTIVSFNATPDALQAQIGDHVWFSHPYLGFQDDYRVMGLVMNPDKTITVTLQQYDDDIYSVDDIAALPGPTAQSSNKKFSGADAGIVPAEPTNIYYAKICPNATLGADTGYMIDCDDVLTGYKDRYDINIVPANVNTTTDTITFAGHGFETGDEIRYYAGGLFSGIGGLTTDTNYYAIRVDADNFKVASTLVNAQAGTAINLTTAAGAPFFRRNGDLVAFNDIVSYGFAVQGTTTKYFYSSTSKIAVPATAWPEGLISAVRVWAIAADGTTGISGEATYISQADPTLKCPIQPVENIEHWQICDGTTGIAAAKTFGITNSETSQAEQSGPHAGTVKHKVGVRWQHGPSVGEIASYKVRLTYYAVPYGQDPSTATEDSGNTNGWPSFAYRQIENVAKAAGATESSYQTYTFTFEPTIDATQYAQAIVNGYNASNAAEYFAGAIWRSVYVAAIDSNGTEVWNTTDTSIVNPTSASECSFARPADLEFFQVCDAGSLPNPTASPLVRAGGNAKVGFRIQHGPDVALTDKYIVSFRWVADGNVYTLAEEEFNKAAGATTGGWQTYISTNTLNFAAGTSYQFSGYVKAKRNTGPVISGVQASATFIANPDPNTSCTPVPFDGPNSVYIYQICDGSSGVSPSYSGGTALPIANFYDSVNSLIGVRIEHGPNVSITDQYLIEFELQDNTGVKSTISHTVTRTGTTGYQYVVLPNPVSFTGLVSPILVSTQVTGKRNSGTISSTTTTVSGTITVNSTPSSGSTCFPLTGPETVQIYQVCSGTGGTSSPGASTDPAYLPGIYEGVNAVIGFKIEHGADAAVTDEYELVFQMFLESNPSNLLADFTHVVARSGTTGFQYALAPNVVTFPTVGPGDALTIGASVISRKNSGTVTSDATAFSGTITVATTPSAGNGCGT